MREYQHFVLFQNQELKDNAANYFIEISQVLNSVPRQLLLIMKTNDVLRGIEAALQTRANASSFINMSKCCVRAMGNHKLNISNSFLTSCKARLYTQWHLVKVDLYEFYLWLTSSVLARWYSRVTAAS